MEIINVDYVALQCKLVNRSLIMLNKIHKQIIQLKQTNLVFADIAWFTYGIMQNMNCRTPH